MKRYHFPRLALVAVGIPTLAAGMLGAASPRNLVAQVQASADDTFIELNHPEGVRGTRAWSLNAQGDVIGSYDDANEVRHGFIWHDGRFTTIDHPDAGHGRPGPLGPQGTTLYDINRFGDITGRYINRNHEAHSFVLRRGTFTPIDDPASPVGPGYGTQADGINDAGDIVLHTQPGQRIFEAYLLRDGQFKKIADPHGVGGTVVNGINAAGIIVGEWLDGNGVSHGMVYCNGIFTTHDDPNAAGGLGTGLKKVQRRRRHSRLVH